MILDDLFPLPLLEDGRVVRGVNTTCDVGVGEITRQAAKFGFKVSKDGVPVRTFTVDDPKDQVTKHA